MSYNPHDYVIDGRRIGAGYALAAVALICLFAVSCPSTSAKTDVVAEAHNMQYIGARFAPEKLVRCVLVQRGPIKVDKLRPRGLSSKRTIT